MSAGGARRGMVVGAGLVGAAVAALATTQVWATGAVVDTVRGQVTVSAPGASLAPTVVPAALAGAAAVVAAGFAGRAVRLLASLAAAALGVWGVVAAVGVALAPSAPLAAVSAAAVGRSAGVTVVDVGVTVWAWVAALGAAGLAVAGVAAVLACRSWAGLSAKYEQPGSASEGRRAQAPTAVDDWDRLTRGEDPTS